MSEICNIFSVAFAEAGEILGPMLLTRRNLTYYQDLMAALRRAIEERRLAGFVAAFMANNDASGRSRSLE